MFHAGANIIATGTSDFSLSQLNDGFEKYSVDFLDSQSVDKFISFLSTKKIDVCINNAGINKIAPIDDVQQEDWDAIIKVNLTTPFRIIKTISNTMKRHNFGS